MEKLNISVQSWLEQVPEGLPAHTSLLSSGLFNTKLLLPATTVGEFCLPLHGIFSPSKYLEVATQFEVAAQSTNLTVIEEGTIFLGHPNYWHFLMDGVATLRPPTHLKERLYFRNDLPASWISFVMEFSSYAYPKTQFQCEVFVPDGFIRLKQIRCPWVGSLQGRIERLINLSPMLRGFANRARRVVDCVWVSRSSASYRRLQNESELIYLTKRYFKDLVVVDPSELSLEDQIALFSDARIVIGPHGAGLTNSIFSRRLHRLVELWHSAEQPFFKLLSSAMGAAHSSIEGVPARTTEIAIRPDNQDFIISEDALARELAPLTCG